MAAYRAFSASASCKSGGQRPVHRGVRELEARGQQLGRERRGRWPAALRRPSGRGPDAGQMQAPARTAGRPSCRASARVNSAFVTGVGAVKFSAPASEGVSSANRIAPIASARLIQLIHWRPLPSLPPRPMRNTRQHPRQRSAGRVPAPRRSADAQPGCRPRSRAARRPPTAGTTRPESPRQAPSPHPAVRHRDRHKFQPPRQRAALCGLLRQAGQQSCERARRIHPAGRHFAAVGSRPAPPRHAGAGEMDGEVDAFQHGWIRHGRLSARIPRQLALPGRRSAHQLHGRNLARCKRMAQSCAQHTRCAAQHNHCRSLSSSSYSQDGFVLAFDELAARLPWTGDFSRMGMAFDWGNIRPAGTRGGGR